MSSAADRSERQQRERERDLERFLTLVDAIVAIAVTLLVLPLVELTSDAGEFDTVGELLNDNSPQLWSFALSFYVIAQLWFGQHYAVGPLLRGDRRITTLLTLWAFTIVVLPFPTALVASPGGDEAITKVIYVGTMAVSVLLVAAVRLEIRRHPELTDGTPDDATSDGLVTAGLMLLALGVMVLFPGLSYYPMLLLVLGGPLGTRVGAWVAARSRAT